MRQIEEAYLKTGTARFGYLHYVIKGQESQWAAEASECAGEQGEEQFWSYHDKLFAEATGNPEYSFQKDHLKQYAEELGLEMQAFNDCLDTEKYKSVVEIDSQLARYLNFQATPSFLINGRALIGAQPFEIFKDYIDTALNP